MQKALISLV